MIWQTQRSPIQIQRRACCFRIATSSWQFALSILLVTMWAFLLTYSSLLVSSRYVTLTATYAQSRQCRSRRAIQLRNWKRHQGCPLFCKRIWHFWV